MSRPSNVELFLRGEKVNLRPEQELEVIDRLIEALQGPADAYEPVYKEWRKVCRQVRRGKLAKDSKEYLEAKARMQQAKQPLHEILVRLVNFVANDVSEASKQVAKEKVQEIMKRSCVVQALVSVPGWNKIKKKVIA